MDRGSFSSEQDAHLCRRAQDGDVSSANRLIQEYLPFVRSIVSRFRSTALESEDLLQEGLIGLFNAVLAYDSSRGVAFSSFAYRCVHNRLLSAIAAAGGPPGAAGYSEEELSAFSEKTQAAGSDPQEILQTRENMRSWTLRARQCLSPMEQRVLGLYLSGDSYREIAERLQKSEKSVDNAMQRARRKMRLQR